MNKIYVSDFLERMNGKYRSFREEWDDLDRRWNAEQNRWENETKRGWSSMSRKLSDQKQHGEKLRELKSQFAELSERAKTAFNGILADADKAFERRSRPTPEQIDSNMVELLRSGILSDNELLSSVGDYKSNLTMLRQFAPFLDARARITQNTVAAHKLSALAVECKNASFPYREPLETFASLALEVLHRDPARAAAYAKALEEKYPALLEKAESLAVEVEQDEH